MKRILLLGGVTEALAIARTLGPQHVYSLAGVGRVPTDLTCEVRVGGYGGAEGLARYIRDEGIDLLLDATHPYAAQISQNAALAAAASDIPCWALRRPAWVAQTGDDWREVAHWSELVEVLAPFQRPLFTLGREPLEHLHEIPPEQKMVIILNSDEGVEVARLVSVMDVLKSSGFSSVSIATRKL